MTQERELSEPALAHAPPSPTAHLFHPPGPRSPPPAPQESDLYYRLRVERCFFVGQMTAASEAELLPGEVYRAAEADPLRTVAVGLTQHMNADRMEDVMRIWCALRALGYLLGAGRGRLPCLRTTRLVQLFPRLVGGCRRWGCRLGRGGQSSKAEGPAGSGRAGGAAPAL